MLSLSAPKLIVPSIALPTPLEADTLPTILDSVPALFLKVSSVLSDESLRRHCSLFVLHKLKPAVPSCGVTLRCAIPSQAGPTLSHIWI